MSDSLSFSTSSIYVCTVYPLLCPGQPNTRLLRNIRERAAGEIVMKKEKEGRGGEKVRKRERASEQQQS